MFSRPAPRAIVASRMPAADVAAGQPIHLTLVRRQTHHIDDGLHATLNAAEMRAAEIMEADDWIGAAVIRIGGPLGPVASVVGGE